MTDAVLFRSDAFSLEPTVVEGKTADLPLGLDLARELRDRLARHAPDLRIDEPIWEDWGTVLCVKDGPAQYYINVQWLPAAEFENQWGIFFSRPRGCLLALFGPQSRPEDCRPMQVLVAKVLEEGPDLFFAVEWLSQAAYDNHT